jgi:PKD repeat protein
MFSSADTASTRLGCGVRRRQAHLARTGIIAFAIGLVAAPAALAAPANDDFAAATPLTALPFTDVVDTTDATLEPGEPSSCHPADDSVWYSLAPAADATIRADAAGSSSIPQVAVYRQDSSGLSGLTFLGCDSFGFGPAVVEVQAGSTYYLRASTLFGEGGALELNGDELTPPANDDFADATTIESLPFSDVPDLLAAGAQPGEPGTCVGPGAATVWYAFTPTVTDSYAADRTGGFGPIAVHRGDSLASLEEVACASFSTAVFRGEAGRTYHLQVGAGFPGMPSGQLSLRVAPPATASFFHYPSDPSAFDTVQFHDTSFDVAQIASRLWGFGDGASATGCCPSHRYAADGEYEAELAITTRDGRSATTSATVSVKTHDVAIARLSVPKSARVGQVRQLGVDVANTRYTETVEVTLLRSVPGGGFERVGQVTQDVPARAKGRMTSFDIAYTIAPDDATLGKVSFQAVATILGARDANSADNTITALPTKVTR